VKKLISILIVGFIFFFFGNALGQPHRVSENLRREEVLLPVSAPDKAGMEVQDGVVFVDADGLAGILVFYDNPRTKWEFDYVEFYDLEGNLLLVSWIDDRGLCQVAMDRGLLDAEEPAVDGVLVMIAVGTAL
jgi:hypothetical protein